MERIVYRLAQRQYPHYPDTMPAFQYKGDDDGKGLLESALAQPRQSFGGRYLYRTIYDKAAALFVSIIENHALIDGNKRLALTTVHVFLSYNGVLFAPSSAEAVSIALSIAESKGKSDRREISKWIRRNSIGVETLERSDLSPQVRTDLFELKRSMATLASELRRIAKSGVDPGLFSTD